MGCGASSNKNDLISNPQQLKGQQSVSIAALYQKKQLIGKGTYGKVYRCINRKNNQQYALKVVQLNAKNRQEALKDLQNIKSQISVLKKLNHPNVIKYYNFQVSPDQNSVQIVLQLIQGGTLKDYIEKQNRLNEGLASHFCKQILCGLQYLHSQNILHRDLKCANILLAKDNVIKITDFGTAKIIKQRATDDIAKLSASLKGTPYYMAPQVLKRMGHNYSADIWSLGCTLIEMISGKAPWTGVTTNFEQIIGYISLGIHPPYPPKISIECQRFLDSCLDTMPSKRWNAYMLLTHDFITRSKRKISMNQNTPPAKTSLNQTPHDTIQLIQQREKPKALLQQNSQNNKSNFHQSSHSKNIIRPKRISASNQNKNHNKNSMKSHKQAVDLINIETPQQSSKMSYAYNNSQDISNLIEELNSDLDQNSFEKNLNLKQSQSSNIAQKKKRNQNSKFKVSKTSTTVKMTEQNILSLGLQQYQMGLNGLHKNSNQIQIMDSLNMRSNTQFSADNSIYGQVINTQIAKAERNRYIEQQKILKEKRDQQKRKWEQQLKQGAQMLKKQISNRYVYSQLQH